MQRTTQKGRRKAGPSRSRFEKNLKRHRDNSLFRTLTELADGFGHESSPTPVWLTGQIKRFTPETASLGEFHWFPRFFLHEKELSDQVLSYQFLLRMNHTPRLKKCKEEGKANSPRKEIGLVRGSAYITLLHSLLRAGLNYRSIYAKKHRKERHQIASYGALHLKQIQV
ncbi:hypothetical protein SAMN02744124_01291 [Paenibacillus barengoltzii J12]|jgi:hypothetical protein|uniref:Transposase n=1 Tax=Paenibacillus barengoltzii J12 TaxID=935846 RepID=A0ABY1LV12_9BACL|nr:hypothetical protein SAMN02744102_01100 [Paenibacillus barengoltzii]SMF09919.1 hypothetical protein SAMN02744124_01291 [Paenibacillus barengoltzii J12]